MKTSVLAINFSADDLASSLRTAPFALVAKDLVPARNLLMERPARPAALNACESMTQERISARKRSIFRWFWFWFWRWRELLKKVPVSHNFKFLTFYTTDIQTTLYTHHQIIDRSIVTIYVDAPTLPIL